MASRQRAAIFSLLWVKTFTARSCCLKPPQKNTMMYETISYCVYYFMSGSQKYLVLELHKKNANQNHAAYPLEPNRTAGLPTRRLMFLKKE